MTHLPRLVGGALVAAAGLALLASSAWGADAALIAKGKRLAEANCAVCHAIGPEGASKDRKRVRACFSYSFSWRYA